jgi:molybdopterin molybdotransferase
MPQLSLAIDCAAGDELVAVAEAFETIVGFAAVVEGEDRVASVTASGRILAHNVATAIPLPPFDHSAVDGFGVAEADLNKPTLRLSVASRTAAGDRMAATIDAGRAVRLFTGAPIPPGVAGVVLEERCELIGRSLLVTVPIPAGANIRRSGEDVAAGSVIVEADTILDARHVAMLVAAGVPSVDVRKRLRVAVLSNGNELRESGTPLAAGQIHDANRPMLMALLSGPAVELLDLGCHADDPRILAEVFAEAARRSDVIISSGGVAGSDADHVARAVASAGGALRRFRLAIKPGKPILAGRIGRTAVLGLPGNPVAALVNFLLFGRALVAACAGAVPKRPVGQPAIAASPFGHARGRTEFVPARICGVSENGVPRIEKLGRGGSARLRPLVLADGFAEIPAEAGELEAGNALAFHPFRAAFAP